MLNGFGEDINNQNAQFANLICSTVLLVFSKLVLSALASSRCMCDMRVAYMTRDAVEMAQGLSHGCLNGVARHHDEAQPDVTEPLVLVS